MKNSERLYCPAGWENLKITAIYAWVATEAEGGEGIPAILLNDGAWMPLIGADIDRVKSLKKYAEQHRRDTGQPVRLVRFSKTEDLEVLP